MFGENLVNKVGIFKAFIDDFSLKLEDYFQIIFGGIN
jgi:hypothetical protein